MSPTENFLDEIHFDGIIFAKSFAPGSPGGRWGTNDSMRVKVFELKKKLEKNHVAPMTKFHWMVQLHR